MTDTTCSLCEKEVENQGRYCPGHERAHFEIERKYPEWKSAYGDISWERYLERILTLKETGDFAKAVASEELRRHRALHNNHASNHKLSRNGN